MLVPSKRNTIVKAPPADGPQEKQRSMYLYIKISFGCPINNRVGLFATIQLKIKFMHNEILAYNEYQVKVVFRISKQISLKQWHRKGYALAYNISKYISKKDHEQINGKGYKIVCSASINK